MSRVIIINNHISHLEVVESCVVRISLLFDVQPGEIFITLFVGNEKSFIAYITEKYKAHPFIRLHIRQGDIRSIKYNEFDFVLFATLTDFEKPTYDKIESQNKKYISHTILDSEREDDKCFFLTPLGPRFFYCDILPFAEQASPGKVPIYVIQGNITTMRRDYSLISLILDNHIKSKDTRDFRIKFIGRGGLPPSLSKPEYKKYIVLRNNLNFFDYHKEFLDAYCILPLISKETHPQYFTTKLTSTINYGRAYRLWFLLDKDLDSIYNLDKVFTYNSDEKQDIYHSFNKSLSHFYEN